MAEERNLGLARVVDEISDDEDPTKAELQRRMEEARADISQTVTEIKDTVANQYQAVKDSVTEALDWREQYRKRPLAWSVGALSVGFIVGYSLGGALTGDGSDFEDESPWDIDDYEPAISTKASSARYQTPQDEAGRGAAASIPSPAPSYAAQAITGAPHAPSSYGAAESASDYSPGYGGEAEPDKPGLLERFKETKAYDRLQEEVSSLGDRFIDEVAKVGTTVVLPALFTKIKDLFGVDLSNKQQQSQSGGAKASQATGGASTGSSSASGGPQTSTGGGSSGGSTYGTSENRAVGASSSERDDYGRRSSSSGGGQL